MTISTINDDGPWKGKDDGKSFWFEVKYTSEDLKLWASLDGYTRNRGFDARKKLVFWDRIDHMKIYAIGKVWETQLQIGDRVWKITWWIGWWVQWIWDYGGQTIQTTWHEKWPANLTWGYNFANRYEVWRDKKKVSGITPDLRGSIESKITIAWEWSRRIDAVGNLDLTLPLDRRYGETAIKAGGRIEWHFDRVHGYVGADTHIYRTLPVASQVIAAAQNNPNTIIRAWASVDILKTKDTTTSLFIDVARGMEKWIPAKNQTQGTIGINVKF
jgi:hypothetical protein